MTSRTVERVRQMPAGNPDGSAEDQPVDSGQVSRAKLSVFPNWYFRGFYRGKTILLIVDSKGSCSHTAARLHNLRKEMGTPVALDWWVAVALLS